MGFKDILRKIKNFFQKEEVSQETVNKILPESEQIQEKPKENTTETIQELLEETPPIVEVKSQEDNIEEAVKGETIKEEVREAVKEADSKMNPSEKPLILPSEKPDSSRRFISIDLNKLELNKIEREAETITAYSKLLAKDIVLFRDEKDETKLSGITTKFRMIFTHSMELKNLLETLNELFYIYLLNNLSENHKTIEHLKDGQKKLNEIVTLLAKLGLYDELFNSEKTPEAQKNLESEIEKGNFLKEINDLGKHFVESINSKKSGLPANTISIANLLKGH